MTIPVPDSRHLKGDELTHAALFGGDVASPTTLEPPDDAVIAQSGLVSEVIRPGVGERTPQGGDTVVMNFTGWTSDGERFDSTSTRGAPDRFRLETLSDGWREGVSQMVVGEKRRLWIPERLAFGSVPSPGRPSGDIVLEVELVDIVPAPKAPSDDELTKPPPDARQTASGLRYVVITEGAGTRRPTRDDQVLVHYSGWNSHGQLFDSSITRGEPVAFGVMEVIPGWTEMLELMVEGQRVRVWIPARLAYGDTPARPGAPAGDLVFEIELLQIQ
jgi:FKBP-type peptidyl-prolyl cis-trans isomerase